MVEALIISIIWLRELLSKERDTNELLPIP